MELRLLIYCILVMVATGCETNALQSHARSTLASPEITLAQFQSNAAAFHSIVELPVFETSSNEMAASVRETIKNAESILDRIGRLPTNEVTFSNTVRALADEGFLTSTAENRLTIIQKTATNDTVREAASEQLNAITEWDIGADYRHDVYRALKAYTDIRILKPTEGRRRAVVADNDARFAASRPGIAEAGPKGGGRSAAAYLIALCGQFDDNAATAEAPLVFTRGGIGRRAGGFS